MPDWRIFRGDQQPHQDATLPTPPPWRRFPRSLKERGGTFQASAEEIQMVNAALYLRRPLLVTGPPGSGKSSLAYAVAKELDLGDVLVWPINSRSTLNEGLYRYDAIARLRDASLEKSAQERAGKDAAEPDIGDYLTLGPLGTALLPRPRPRVLLIDEIDKSDIDLPNDLLHVFEEGRYEIPELIRLRKQPRVRIMPSDGEKDEQRVWIDKGRVETREFPVVVITSNGERELPPAFLRRCLRLKTPPPDLNRLTAIVAAHLGPVASEPVQQLLQDFITKRDQNRLVAVDQLLNAIFMISGAATPDDADWGVVKGNLLLALDEE